MVKTMVNLTTSSAFSCVNLNKPVYTVLSLPSNIHKYLMNISWKLVKSTICSKTPPSLPKNKNHLMKKEEEEPCMLQSSLCKLNFSISIGCLVFHISRFCKVRFEKALELLKENRDW